MDFKIDMAGEIVLNKNDFDTVSKDDERFQQAFCRVQSIKIDWDNETTVGAFMEQLRGKEINDNLINDGKQLIINAVTEETYKPEEVYVESKTDKDIVEYTVYLKNLDNLTSKKFIVTIDLIGGINVRLGVD